MPDTKNEQEIYPPHPHILAQASIDQQKHSALYQKSITDNDAFWRDQAQTIDWIKPFKTVQSHDFNKNNFHIKWFEEGTLNVCLNCVDRHLEKRGDKTALIFEGDEPDIQKHISFRMLHEEVCIFANSLKKIGVKKGDRVTIYMPMIPEAVYAMLACARIGAVHSVVFGGFSPSSLANRIIDCESRFVITADEGVRGGRKSPLKKNVDDALSQCPESLGFTASLVVTATGADVPMQQDRDIGYDDIRNTVSKDCPAEEMAAEDPLFILYTSGSTGKPKGVLHTTGGYLLYASTTHRYAFDIKEDDVYWCTADVGWVTGHSYIVYGPLANGTTSLVFAGIPTYPGLNRFFKVCDKHKVTVFYTAPTAIRALMRHRDEAVQDTERTSLRILGTVGEPINPEAWRWYYETVGRSQCAIIDTWWQTETGGFLITPLPGAIDLKPGSATKPFFGIEPVLLDEKGTVLEGEATGYLCIKNSWPGQMRGVYGDEQRFFDTYFSQFPGHYYSGDGARRDKDGYYWITGRMDDVLNVSGHRLGTAEIESALVHHPDVAEAAVVGFPHEIKGEGIAAWVTLKVGVETSEELRKALREWVGKEISPIAKPDLIMWAPGLPKTRSGKIMRRILRKIVHGQSDDLGDISTLAEPDIVAKLVALAKDAL